MQDNQNKLKRRSFVIGEKTKGVLSTCFAGTVGVALLLVLARIVVNDAKVHNAEMHVLTSHYCQTGNTPKCMEGIAREAQNGDKERVTTYVSLLNGVK
jgi:hypothetical protein